MRYFVILIALLVSSAELTKAQSGPGASLFRYRCEAQAIVFLTYEGDAISVTLAQVAIALTTAVSNHQHQLVATGDDISVWALQSNELQVHRDSNVEGTKMIWPSNICGPIFNAPSEQPEVIAYAQSLGSGQTFAYTRVTGRGTGFALANPSGHTVAYAQIAPSESGHTQKHTVRAGENLFRIALRYGTTVQHLMALNNLSNAHWINVGQQLIIG